MCCQPYGPKLSIVTLSSYNGTRLTVDHWGGDTLEVWASSTKDLSTSEKSTCLDPPFLISVPRKGDRGKLQGNSVGDGYPDLILIPLVPDLPCQQGSQVGAILTILSNSTKNGGEVASQCPTTWRLQDYCAVL